MNVKCAFNTFIYASAKLRQFISYNICVCVVCIDLNPLTPRQSYYSSRWSSFFPVRRIAVVCVHVEQKKTENLTNQKKSLIVYIYIYIHTRCTYLHHINILYCSQFTRCQYSTHTAYL